MDFRWPSEGPVRLSDGLTAQMVVEALYAPSTLAVVNAVPAAAPTALVVCAPTDEGRLITVICARQYVVDDWEVFAARDAREAERALWKRHTS